MKKLFANPAGLLKSLRTIGIFLGCITAAFVAADEYWELHNPKPKPSTDEPVIE